jgi:putative transposase
MYSCSMSLKAPELGVRPLSVNQPSEHLPLGSKAHASTGEAAFRKGRKCPVGNSWRMDETYIKIKGQWRHLYRAVDKAGQTIDFLLTARRFLTKAVRQSGLPEKVTIDKSGANTATLDAPQEDTGAKIEIRQIKYLNNLVEPNHRAVKRIIRPMLGFHSFRSARITLYGVELMHMIMKGQMITVEGPGLSAAERFYSLAA